MLIAGGKLLTMEGKTYETGCILIKGKTIVKIAENISPAENDDGVIVSVAGGWVMPGLIDVHCHVGISEEKSGAIGDDCNECNAPLTPFLKAIDAINPMDASFHSAIGAGITSLMIGPGSANVVGGQFAFVKTHGRCIDDMVLLEPAAMKIAFGENPKSGYGGKGLMPGSRMSIAALLRETLFDAKKYWQDKSAAQAKGEPFQEEFRKECWIPVLQKKIPLKAHAHRADDILTAIRIAKFFDVNLTLDHCSEGHLIAREIQRARVPAIVGPSLSTRDKVELKYADFKTAGILHQAGVKVAITTDHPVTAIQSLPLCAALAAKEGLGIDEGLRAITINAAEIGNVAHRVGSLKVGKDADIAIFDGNPMEVFTRCLYTIIDGVVVYEGEKSIRGLIENPPCPS